MIRSPKSLGNCLYQDESGAYYLRYCDSGKQKWHKLKSIKERMARQEATGLQFKLSQFKSGMGPNPFEAVNLWSNVSQQYLDSQCQDSHWQARSTDFCAGEKKRIKNLLPFFGKKKLPEIDIEAVSQYADWRMERVKKGTGHRSVEIECVTLSNVMSFAVRKKLIQINLVRSQRPKYTTRRDKHGPDQRRVRNCREVCPVDGAEVHKIADLLFAEPLSQALAFQFLLECMTGCRTNEVLLLRTDGQDKSTPGFIQGECLFLRRSKRGINPYFRVYPELRDMLDCLFHWHANEFPESPYWLPGRRGGTTDKTSLCHALARLHKEGKIAKRTSHGCRAFYVNKRRSDGATDDLIAAEIGISEVRLIASTYGDRDPEWGTKPLSWLPSEGLSSWSKWRLPEEKVVGL